MGTAAASIHFASSYLRALFILNLITHAKPNTSLATIQEGVVWVGF